MKFEHIRYLDYKKVVENYSLGKWSLPFRLGLMIFMICLQLSAFSQDLTRKQALDALEEGNIRIGVNLLKDYLKTLGKEKETKNEIEKVFVYHQLSQAYAENKRILFPADSADYYFQKLLKIDYEHEIDTSLTTDPAELVYLYESFRTWPVLHLSLFAGGNAIRPIVLRNYYIDNAEQSSGDPLYASKAGFQLGGQIDAPIHKISDNLRVSVGLTFNRKSYQLERTLNTFVEAEGSAGSFSTLSFIENQTWLDIPLTLSYHFDRESKYNFRSLKKKIVPYIYGGIAYNLMLAAKIQDIRRDNIGISSQSGFTNTDSGKLLQNPALRNQHNFSFVGGVGLKYKVASHYLFVDARYIGLIRNIINVSNRYENPELLYTFGHLDNDFRLDHYSISFGFTYTLYRPKKLSKVRK